MSEDGWSYRDSPNRWIDRAERMRNNAEAMPTEEGRRTCLTIAEQYYCMAEQAQRRMDWQASVRSPDLGTNQKGPR